MPEPDPAQVRTPLADPALDAQLAPEIQPEAPARSGAARCVLLTGATGFLGRRVARELLRDPSLQLVCLVRSDNPLSARARLEAALAQAGITPDLLHSRVEALCGDVGEPALGLDAQTFDHWAERLDAVYHCAAQVDWVRGYAALRRVNVEGVRRLITLACRHHAKRLVFASSLAVCYTRDGPATIDEETDLLPFVDGMPLGYARSKCVAEALLRKAAHRGLPVTVLRPALISGDSQTGASNAGDIIAALIQSCVATGIAMDTDWALDCVPVDFVAEVMAQIPQGEHPHQVLHLAHAQPRPWRELVLWMNLHGYPVRLTERAAWIRQLFELGQGRGTLLHAQRRFFMGQADQHPPYETYLAFHPRRIDSKRSRGLLKQFGLREAPLDGDVLHAYFDDYRRAGLLPGRPGAEDASVPLDALWPSDAARSTPALAHWQAARRTRIGTEDGLLSGLAEASDRQGAGLWRLDADRDPSAPHRAVLKVKVRDQKMIRLASTLAGLCRPALGALFAQHPDALGLERAHAREPALYALDEPLLRRNMPACHGTLSDPQAERWGVLIEYLPEAESGQIPPQAQGADLDALLRGLAEIHATGYLAPERLHRQPWWSALPDAQRMAELRPLWRELADHAAPWFERWCGPSVRGLQTDFIARLPQWWQRLRAFPATLIHNDFNPRNIVFREQGGTRRLCAFDWELATLGPPQHDLAEMLCYIWRADASDDALAAAVDAHRIQLEHTAQRRFDPAEWRSGFALALRHLLINRFAMYTLLHRFRPLKVLPNVMRNWSRLERATRSWVVVGA